VDRYFVIAFTHHSTGLKNLESLFIDQSFLPARLEKVKQELSADGLMYLATCNRVEFIFSIPGEVEKDPVKKLLAIMHPSWDSKKTKWALSHVLELRGEEAVKHVFEVASSLDSLVVGEREIITQVRTAYEWSHEHKLTDDFIRILIKKTIEVAKRIYTDTKIADKPVSVMSLACRKMQEWRVGFDSRVLMIGAGQTADIMVKYLTQHGFKQFAVFNRTVKHAKELAAKYKIEAYSLDQLKTYKKGFDVIITCAKTTDPIITEGIFEKLAIGEKTNKILVDLGLPPNIDKAVLKKKNVKSVGVKDLGELAKKNMEERKAEIKLARVIIEESIRDFYTDIKSRKIDIAMSGVPKRMQEIKEQAISSVFHKEIQSLSPGSREVLEKVVDYLEKKYISIPMQLAKKILMNQDK